MDTKKHKTLHGYENLVGNNIVNTRYSYAVLDCVLDYKEGVECIVVSSLNPDYYLLFGEIKLIITTKGSLLSHLSVLARESNISILIIKELNKEILKSGVLKIKGGHIEFYNNNVSKKH